MAVEQAEGPRGPDPGAYCRDIEAYLCRRNGGHLIRIVGPSFDLVTGWARTGMPLRIVFRGIDRFVERQQSRGGSRRPARIEFCEADVRAVFDEWRRAIGPAGSGLIAAADGSGSVSSDESDAASGDAEPRRRLPSLPAHLERVHVRLSSLLASARLHSELHHAIADAAAAIDELRQRARARGESRTAILEELARRDALLVDVAWQSADDDAAAQARSDASADLAAYRDRMASDRWAAAVHRAAQELLRERWGLPRLTLE